jgi:hypothetical protein
MKIKAKIGQTDGSLKDVILHAGRPIGKGIISVTKERQVKHNFKQLDIPSLEDPHVQGAITLGICKGTDFVCASFKVGKGGLEQVFQLILTEECTEWSVLNSKYLMDNGLQEPMIQAIRFLEMDYQSYLDQCLKIHA